MAKTTWRKGTPLRDDLQERLRALVKEKGESKVAELLDVGRVSVVRAAAGLGLRRSTAFVIETKIDSIAPKKRVA